jgi:hypothetical protein
MNDSSDFHSILFLHHNGWLPENPQGCEKIIPLTKFGFSVLSAKVIENVYTVYVYRYGYISEKNSNQHKKKRESNKKNERKENHKRLKNMLFNLKCNLHNLICFSLLHWCYDFHLFLLLLFFAFLLFPSSYMSAVRGLRQQWGVIFSLYYKVKMCTSTIG